MLYPQESIEEVRSGNDIIEVIGAYITLKNRGGNFFGLCPFHNEKTPSFSVSRDKQMYYCFGCSAGGNVISFIMQIENYNFLDALKFLAARIHYTLPEPSQNSQAKTQLKNIQLKNTLYDIHKKAGYFYHDNLISDSKAAHETRKYLENRNIDPKIIKRFALGLSLPYWDGLLKNLQNHRFNLSDMVESGLVQAGKKGGHFDRFRNRLMFPILDLENHVVGFGARVIENTHTAKYLNSPETLIFDKSRQLYGIHAARKARSKEIIIVEGYMDVLTLHQAGYPQTVGVLGTALTPHHARLLKRINANSVILLFDRDQAGEKAVLRAIPILVESGLKVKCLQTPENVKDPDEFIEKYGPAAFSQLIATAKNHVTFRIELLAKEYDLQGSKKPANKNNGDSKNNENSGSNGDKIISTESRINFTQKAASVLAGIENAIEADAYIRETANYSGLSPEAILTEMDKQRGEYYTQSPAPKDRPGLFLNLKGKGSEKGLIEARKGILSVLLAYPDLSLKLQEFLSPEEMGGEIEQKLLSLAYEDGKRKRQRLPADVIAQFETLEEQQRVTELLKDNFHFDSNTDLEKAVNEMWRIIKGAWLKGRIEEIEQKNGEIDLNAINTLGKAIRNLEKQYITITNG